MGGMEGMGLKSDFIKFDDCEDWFERSYSERWSDGLPVVPPTPRRVLELVSASGREPDEVVGVIPPRGGIATVESIAINAVMAGCRPEYFPVVLAAVEAMLEPPFNLHGVQTTTHINEPLVIVSGPAVQELEINTGVAVFGHGFRANGAIGRAVRLVLWNLGGSYPLDPDMTTFAHPGQWSFCIGEILGDSNPWVPVHVERGFNPDDSVVTMFSCEAPQSIWCGGTPEEILSAICSAMQHTGSNNFTALGETLLVVSPLNARILSRAGFTKEGLRTYLWENVRLRVAELKKGMWQGTEVSRFWPSWLNAEDPDTQVPIVAAPEDIHLIVAGGEGRFCASLPGWGVLGGLAVSKKVGR